MKEPVKAGYRSPCVDAELGGGLRAISRRWKYAPDTTNAIMIID